MFERRRRLKKFLNNLPLAILSLFISVSLWFYVVTGEEVEMDLDLSLKPIVPEGFCIVSYSPRKVTLYVRAKKRQVMLLSRSKVVVKVENVKPGKTRISLDESTIRLPVIVGDVDFRVMGRNVLTVDADSLIKKKVKVLLSNGLKTEPDSVFVIGPARFVGKLTSVLTDSVPVKGNYTTITPGGKLIKVIPSVVKVVP